MLMLTLISQIASVSVLVEYQTYFPLGDFVRANGKKVGTVPTCSRRIFSLPNFNQHVIEFFFRSRRANKVAKWKIDFKVGLHWSHELSWKKWAKMHFNNYLQDV